MSELAQQLIAECKRTRSTKLDLSDCDLADWPEAIFDCVWLEELYMGNGIWNTEGNSWSITNLTPKNGLSEIPAAIRKLNKLKKLGLFAYSLENSEKRGNIKKIFPNILPKSLVNLDISYNKIAEIKGLEKLSNLKYLNLAVNHIIELEPLESLIHLTYLNLAGNNIIELENLKGLVNLTHLNLSDNKINEIKNIGQFENLQELKLRNNPIRKLDIPFAIPSLRLIDIRNTKISELPIWLLENHYLPLIVEKKSSLEEEYGILISVNDIKNVPSEVLDQGREAVIEFLKGEQKPLNECKIIFVGDGGAGKTSLMRRLVFNEFHTAEKTTHGINKISWRGIQNEKGETIKVNLWDFGGQHIQHSLHQFFFTQRVIYILVLNPRNDEKAFYWLDQVAKLGKDSEVLVIYNWKDDKDKQANYLNNFHELRKQYPSLPDPILLSCATGEGIDNFKPKLTEAVLKNEGLKTKYRKEWFNIKERLEKDIPVETNYILYNQYEKWCDEEGYDGGENRRTLLRILDAIGAIVFFDKPVLNNLQVLNPEWITTGAYAILTAERTAQNNGHIGWEDLKEIFKYEKNVFSNKEIKIRYTEDQFNFIIELMLEYKLMQRNPLKDHSYLIPAAFAEKPVQEYTIAKTNCRHYRIQFEAPFEMLIIHRFIAMNIPNITSSNDYWYSGIHIKHAGSNTHALVETNLYSKCIDCWIQGDNIRGFWEVIRDDFREIFSMYHNMQYNEEVLYKKDGKEIFLSYEEMLDSLRNGVAVIPYHPAHKIKDIDVYHVLELFESPQQIQQKMENERMNIKVEVNPNIEVNPHINAVFNNTVDIRIETANHKEFEEIKELLLDLEEYQAADAEWKKLVNEALDELNRLNLAPDRVKQKSSADKVSRIFKKLKDLKDWAAITLLPAEIATKGERMLELWASFKALF